MAYAATTAVAFRENKGILTDKLETEFKQIAAEFTALEEALTARITALEEAASTKGGGRHKGHKAEGVTTAGE